MRLITLRFIFFLCSSGLILFSQSCKKDAPESTPEKPLDTVIYPPAIHYVNTPGFPDCSLDLSDKPVYYFGEPYIGAAYWVVRADTTVSRIIAHPTDSNLFLLGLKIKQAGVGTFGKLMLYNRLQNTLKEIVSYPATEDFDWNKDGKILYMDFGADIYMTDINGGSTQLIESNYSCFGPAWNRSGDRFVFTQSQASIGGNNYVLFYSEDGLRDTFIQLRATNIRSWPREHLLLARDGYIYHDLKNDTFLPSPSNDISIGPSMTQDGEILFASFEYNLRAYNMGTKQFKMAKSGCEANQFIGTSYSQPENRVYVLMRKHLLAGQDSLHERYQVFRMEINGANPELILEFR